MSACLVCLSKLGDVVNAIPIAHAIYKQTGEKVNWVVSLHYVTPLFGCSYITPIKVQYAQDRIDLGMQTAKQSGADQRFLAQCFGKHWKGRHDQPFNRLAWTNCGMGDCFDKVLEYPLIFDRRDSEREARLCFRTITSRKPLMLISVSCGRSSPFPTHGTFADSIRRKWGQHFEIVDLCRVRAARIYDVVGLMDRAAILVTSDSAFVHLATASPRLPVILLHNDQPFLATFPRCHCILKMPYAQWHGRIREVHSAIESHL